MKKILSTILPSLLILSIIFIDHNLLSGDIIVAGIILFFPIIFIFQGLIYSNLKSKKSMVLGFLLSASAIMLPTYIWYNMSGMLINIINCLLLGIATFFLSNYIKRKHILKKQL